MAPTAADRGDLLRRDAQAMLGIAIDPLDLVAEVEQAAALGLAAEAMPLAAAADAAGRLGIVVEEAVDGDLLPTFASALVEIVGLENSVEIGVSTNMGEVDEGLPRAAACWLGRGCALLDPHGDLAKELLDYRKPPYPIQNDLRGWRR